MRKIFYVPTIHTEMDLGSVGTHVGRKGRAIAGEERWDFHRDTVSRFWEGVAAYFREMEVVELKIYQDGLLADGELGMTIVEKVAADGSKNYQLLLELVERGAILMKTESEELLVEEYKRIRDLAEAESLLRKSRALVKYSMGKRELTRKRDSFIAERINKTLEESEKGALFIGAYHNVTPGLSADIRVTNVKDREKLLNYMRQVAAGKDKRRLRELAEYVVSPVSSS